MFATPELFTIPADLPWLLEHLARACADTSRALHSGTDTASWWGPARTEYDRVAAELAHQCQVVSAQLASCASEIAVARAVASG
jgi:hypothetical protein